MDPPLNLYDRLVAETMLDHMRGNHGRALAPEYLSVLAGANTMLTTTLAPFGNRGSSCLYRTVDNYQRAVTNPSFNPALFAPQEVLACSLALAFHIDVGEKGGLESSLESLVALIRSMFGPRWSSERQRECETYLCSMLEWKLWRVTTYDYVQASVAGMGWEKNGKSAQILHALCLFNAQTASRYCDPRVHCWVALAAMRALYRQVRPQLCPESSFDDVLRYLRAPLGYNYIAAAEKLVRSPLYEMLAQRCARFA